MERETLIQEIVTEVAARFRSFGGGKVPRGFNPVAAAIVDTAPSFAAGVDVEDVVRYVIERAEARAAA